MPRKARPTREKKASGITSNSRKASGATSSGRNFRVEWRTINQKLAWLAFQKHDVVFLTGPAGVGKTHLAMAFALSELLERRKKRIVLTRPIVEASGEKLGFLPGELEEKVHPYMRPFYDIIEKMTGGNPIEKERIYANVELEPVAFMRGKTYSDAICIFDEAQNATNEQLKLFMTRFDEGSKLILAGDVTQSDLPKHMVGLPKVVDSMSRLPNIATVEFDKNDIQRHKLVKLILENWPDAD